MDSHEEGRIVSIVDERATREAGVFAPLPKSTSDRVVLGVILLIVVVLAYGTWVLVFGTTSEDDRDVRAKQIPSANSSAQNSTGGQSSGGR